MNLIDADRIAKKLVREHAPGWTIEWGSAKSQFGLCQYRYQNIRLSRPLTLLNTQETFEWVVKHEIAHVLAGPAAGHGRLFMIECHKLGIKGDRCWTRAGTGEVTRIEGKVVGTCKNRCGYTCTMFKVTHASYHRGVCPNCSNRARRQWVHLDWTRDGRPVTPPAKPAPRRRRRRYAY